MTRKMCVYFDYNVFVNYMKNDEVKQKIENLKNKYEYIYSPAYLEEVANIRDNQEQINSHIQIISELFNDMEFLPTNDRGIIKVKENPLKCFNRVNSFISFTKLAEDLNSEFLSRKPFFNMIREKGYIQTIQINNIVPEVLFMNEKIRSIIENHPEFGDYYLFNDDRINIWDSIKDNFALIQRNVSNLFDILEVIGYYPEHKEKYTSRMHDVSHAIYATQADYFVTCDNKFYKKCRAVYSFIGVPTKVLEYSSFS